MSPSGVFSVKANGKPRWLATAAPQTEPATAGETITGGGKPWPINFDSFIIISAHILGWSQSSSLLKYTSEWRPLVNLK